jgi:TolB-like protein
MHPLHATCLIVALTAAAATAQAAMPAAQLLQAQGEVLINGSAPAGNAVARLLSVRTGADGRVQFRTGDGAVIALPPASQIEFGADGGSLALRQGGLRLSTGATPWQVDLPGRSIRLNGYLKLQDCGAGCALAPGLYGRIAQGDAVLEYQGGRSVLKGRAFRWTDAAARPEVLARAPALLDDPGNLADAARARQDVAAQLKAGIEAFGAGDDGTALRALNTVRELAPGEPLIPYYLGLIALRREDNAQALVQLQQYAREDPEGATSRDVPKLLTLLSSAQLQQEVATAVQREREVSASPPEPSSIAVQAFVNRGGDESYRALAKGLAAMIIADLSKVPGLKVLEREKVQLLVNEAKLGDSGLADTASAVRSGRLMRAEKVVVGNFEVQ